MKMNAYDEVKQNSKIVIWGTGVLVERCYKFLSPELHIVGFCDTYAYKWCQNFKNGLPCFSKELLNSNNAVIIAIRDREDVKKVSEELDHRGIKCCHIFEAIKEYLPKWDSLAMKDLEEEEEQNYPPVMMKYIDCVVPYMNCNLKCRYCYIRQQTEFKSDELLLHTPRFIRCALSKKRLGGRALINLCGSGETLSCRSLIPIIGELLEEGHYIHIVTNGTIKKTFDEMRTCGMDLSRVFLKCSFHYMELKRLGLLEHYAKNVNDMRKAGCSVSIELVADDEMIPFIPEIKEFSLEKFGALPHVTIPRVETEPNYPIMTELALNDFCAVWDEFHSDLFDFKMKIMNKKRCENCMAGKYSFHMNLESGDAWKCTGGSYLYNLYDNLNEDIPFEAVGCTCNLPFCYNGHAWLTLGDIEELVTPTYYDMRERMTVDGRHWISETMKDIFTQKLYENNEGAFANGGK